MDQKLLTSMAVASFAALTLLTSCGWGDGEGGSRAPVVDDDDDDDDGRTPSMVEVEPAQIRTLLRGGITAAEAAAAGALQNSLTGVASTAPTRGSGAIATSPATGNVSQANPTSRAPVVVSSSQDGGELTFTWLLERSSGAVTFHGSGSPGGSGAFRTIAFGGASDEYYVSAFTDHDGSAEDADYLFGGFWLNVPADGSSPSFGAFADGNQPFDFSSEVTGTVTYSGTAAGVCNCGGESDTMVTLRTFEASALLSADFANNNIVGSINNFVVDGERLTSGRLRFVNLLGGTINDGFLTGRAELGGTGSQGMWGGEFYGVRDDNNPSPGSVGGTFGVDNGTETFVGAFGARRE